MCRRISIHILLKVVCCCVCMKINCRTEGSLQKVHKQCRIHKLQRMRLEEGNKENNKGPENFGHCIFWI